MATYRDDSEWFDSSYHNPGNFQAILDFRVDSGDMVLKEHFQTCPRNATYRSETVQNELIEIIGEHIFDSVLNEVRQASFFSVMGDEVADVSNEEQLSLVVRFVDSSNQICEEFLEFVGCSGETTGVALSAIILAKLRSYNLNPELLRGQGYDGAGGMAGSVRGVVARIQREFPKALYVHCFAHKLNLVVMKSYGIVPIRNVFGVISKAAEILQKHSDTQYRKNAVADMVAFQHRMENQSSVNILASFAHSRQI